MRLKAVVTLVSFLLFGCGDNSYRVPLPASISTPSASTSQPLSSAPVGVLSSPEVFLSSSSPPALSESSGYSLSPGGVTLDFDSTDIKEVCRVVFGDILKAQFILDPGVSGSVSLRAGPIDSSAALEILEAAFSSVGAALSVDKGVYHIRPAADAAKFVRFGRSGFRYHAFVLSNAKAPEIQPLVQSFLPPGGVVSASSSGRVLLVSGDSATIDRVSDLVSLVDVSALSGSSFGLFPFRSVSVRVASEELRAVFESAGVRFVPVDRLNGVLAISPSPQLLQDVRQWVSRLDRSDSSGGGTLHVYRAQFVDAGQLARTLSRSLGASSTGAGSSSYGHGSSPSQGGASSRDMSSSLGSTGSVGGLSVDPSLGLDSSPKSESSSPSLSLSVPSGVLPSSAGASRELSIRVTPDVPNNALVIVCPPFEYQAVEKLLRELDVMPLQVLIDAVIVEVRLEDGLRFGVQWQFKHGSGNAALNTVGGQIVDAAAAAASGGFGYSFLAKNIEASLEALATQRKLNVLSSPSLMVLNNHEASIRVGDQVPIRTSETTNTSGVTQQGGDKTSALVTGTIEMRDTGIQLKVRPRVNSGGLVTLELSQQVDDVAETTTSRIDSPTIQQRQINSTVSVQDGDSVVLGGLIKESRERGAGGLPFLSSLPVVGSVFGAEQNSSGRTELLVLLTPHVISGAGSASAVSQGIRDRLPALRSSFSGV